MNEYQIITKTKGFAREIFGKELNMPVKFSGKLTRVLGRFIYHTNGSSMELTFSKKLLNNYKEDTIDSVILHELCHWYQYENKLPYRDEDLEFKQLVKSVGGSLTREINIAGLVNAYKCNSCGKIHKSRKKLNLTITICRCGGRLTEVEKERVEDTFEREPGLKENELIINKYKVKQPIEIVACKVEDKKGNVSDLKSYQELISTKKITNKEMITFLKEALDLNDTNLIEIVKNSYPVIYHSSLKYIGKRRFEKLEKLSS